MKICYLENSIYKYNSRDINKSFLRGSETTLINICYELNRLGHDVTIINNCYKNEKIDNIYWKQFGKYNSKDNDYFDIAISNNDIKFFDKINANKKVLISHSIQTLEKFIRKGQLIPYLRHRPIIAVLGDYHNKKRSFLLKLFGAVYLDIGIKKEFINKKIKPSKRLLKAIFTSASYRNLDKLVAVWKKKIHNNLPEAKLFITPFKSNNLKDFNIFIRKKSSTKKLVDEIESSKVYLIPGHVSELNCQAVEEAKELCVPIVTMGIGSLEDQVLHNKNGFIARNDDEFANYIIKLFKDKNKYTKIVNYMKKNRGKKKWSIIVKKFLNSIVKY